MLAKIFIITIVFCLGFLTHAFFFPDVLTNGIADVKQIALPNTSQTATLGTNDLQMITVTFDGKHFSRNNITVPFSRYLKIENQSKETLMSLIANNPLLSTPRGYGYGEALQVRMDKKGQFIIADKNNQQETLVVTVK